jgi:hypothetical protein
MAWDLVKHKDNFTFTLFSIILIPVIRDKGGGRSFVFSVSYLARGVGRPQRVVGSLAT